MKPLKTSPTIKQPRPPASSPLWNILQVDYEPHDNSGGQSLVGSRFHSTVDKTATMLAAELKRIGAIHGRLTLDGHEDDPKRRIRSGSLAVSVLCHYGALEMRAARFAVWTDNLRAVMLALRSLRAMDRHGISVDGGEQYAGFASQPIGRDLAGLFAWAGESVRSADAASQKWSMLTVNGRRSVVGKVIQRWQHPDATNTTKDEIQWLLLRLGVNPAAWPPLQSGCGSAGK